MSDRVLTPAAQADRNEFDSTFERFEGCRCHVSPPCSWCTHPGNPMNQDEDDDCWQQEPAPDLTADTQVDDAAIARLRFAVKNHELGYGSYFDPADVEELLCELAQAKRDAERYRWLRDKAHSLESQHGGGVSCYHAFGGVRELKSLGELDAAVDAHIRASQGAAT